MVRLQPSPYTERQLEQLLAAYESAIYNVEYVKHSLYQHNIYPGQKKLDRILFSLKTMRYLIENIVPQRVVI